jgi:hypothetical protein
LLIFEFNTMDRPPLNNHILLADFQDYYWLKSELQAYCKANEIDSSGGKIELTKRIVKFILTGEKDTNLNRFSIKVSSKFNWNEETLYNDTIITDNYKNTENVRLFF